MLAKNQIFLLSTAIITALTAPTSVVAAPTFVQVSVSGGVVIVNQTNGVITYCSGLLNLNTGTPIGKCAAIGTISVSNLVGNVQINTGTTANAAAFITNTATGAIVQCGLQVNATTGAPLGGCVTFNAQ
jgi:hypothetical protein